jgi:CTP:molybdopterin cytidylyltransferase MocA
MSCPLVILCAGKSERFGSPKGLAPYNSSTWLDFQLDQATKASLTKVILVLGHDSHLYETEIQRIKARTQNNISLFTLINPLYELGPFTSIQLAAREVLKGHESSAFFLPVDCPVPLTKTLNGMQTESLNFDIVVPTFKGVGGHPVLLSRDFLKKIGERNPKTSRLDHLIRDHDIRMCKKLDTHDFRVCTSFNTKKEFDLLWIQLELQKQELNV